MKGSLLLLLKNENLQTEIVYDCGKEEVKNNMVTVKNNNTKEEYKILLREVVDFLDEEMGEEHED